MVRMRHWAGEADGEIDRLRGQLGRIACPLRDAADLDPLLERIGDAHYVLLGEASHGTSEYYTWRARITERLVREKGFSFVAVEGDWPDCYRINRYIKDFEDAGATADDVLRGFARWPTWMWANRETVHLAEWLRGWNENLPEEEQVGFYGLDVYSLWESMQAVTEYLGRSDPLALRQAIQAYRCFEPYGRDERAYARATMLVPASCEEEAISVLVNLRRRAPAYPDGEEAAFDAEQNALCVVNAEKYYRTMVRADAESWNIRDLHMADTLDRLVAFHRARRDVVKAVIWEHNTHIGDARATDMAEEGMLNVGQVVRERHGRTHPALVVIVGFSGHRGSVIAARGWGQPMERMPVPDAMAGSWEDVLHQPESPAARLLLLHQVADEDEWLEPRGHRAIGVVYHPRYEQPGNYVPTVLPERYDALIALEETTALHPLHPARVEPTEIPETYPSGI
jgi:erythromycin esterase